MSQSMEFSQVRISENNFLSKVYFWMAGGLGLSAAASFFTLSNPAFLKAVFTNPALFWGLMIAELGLVFGLSMAIGRLSAAAASALFSVYSLLNGVTLSYIFLYYTSGSIITTFAIASGTFLFFSVYGHTTKADLSSVGQIAFMGLIGILLATLVNIFFKSQLADIVITYIGIAVFIGLIAWDTQKLKRIHQSVGMSAETAHKAAIMGALTLYLDFINLFLMLLRLFGRRRS